MPRWRIPESDLEAIKREVAVEALARRRGVTLSRHGADLIGLCPFHDDKSPSLVVSPKKNLWHCLGACSKGGGPIDWVMTSENLSFRAAVEFLMPELEGQTGSKREANISADVDEAALLDNVCTYYQRRLRDVPDAQAFLKKRGLAHPELIEHFRIGYADRTLCYRLPKQHTKEGKATKAKLQKLGVLRPSGHELLTGCITIPVTGEQGQIGEVYGRRIAKPGELRKGTPQHLYLPGPHRGVLNLRPILDAKPTELVVCEAFLDALSFWCDDVRNVTSAFGTEGITDELVSLLTASFVERVFIAFDADAAGDRAAKKLAARLLEKKAGQAIDVRRVVFEPGTDANEHFRKHDKGSLGALLETAVPVASLDRPGRPRLTPARPEPPKASAPLAAERVGAVIEKASAFAAPETAHEAAEGAAKGSTAREKAGPKPHPIVPSMLVEESPESGEVHLSTTTSDAGERAYRVRGLGKNKSFDVLRINLLAKRRERFFVDSLDLYRSRDRQAFIRGAKDELKLPEETIKKDLGQVLLVLEEIQAKRLTEAMKPERKAPELSAKERAEALELLQDPDLPARILRDTEALGLVGEETGKLLSYLAVTSRKLEKPLAVLIQSSSSAGKSSLMDAVLSMMPDEEVAQYSALTGQSLFYMQGEDLCHKVLAISEDEGADKASYALKLLQSDGKLSIASTQKDAETGKLITETYSVKGPVMLFLTTTAAHIDEELENRCLLLSVSEDAEQTRAIHQSQRKARTLFGLKRKVLRERIRALHQNAQRLLEPLAVVNPYAEKLTFSSSKTRSRRDHEKYLTLIDAIALLHQHQRPKKTLRLGGKNEDEELVYVEVERSDIELAQRLFDQVHGRADDLAPQTRRVLELLCSFVTELAAKKEIPVQEVRFCRRELREATGLGDTQLKVHLGRLVEHEHVCVHVQRNGRRFFYELLDVPVDLSETQYDGDGRPSADLGRATVGGRSALGRPAATNGKANGVVPLAAAWSDQLPAQSSRGFTTADVPHGSAPAPQKTNGELPLSEAH